jgi:hypothetical protein
MFLRVSRSIIPAVFFFALTPGNANAQLLLDPLSPPLISPSTRCMLARDRPAGVDLIVLAPTFTRRSPPGTPEEFVVRTFVQNYGRTASAPGTAVYITREEGISGSGMPSGEPFTLRYIELASLTPCSLSAAISYTITISPCGRGGALYNRCLRNYLGAFFTLFAVSLPVDFRDAQNSNNAFRISGDDLATRFGIP